MNLSKRLSAVAAMIPQGTSIADIGTDHAYLPIELIQNHTVRHAIAMDINEGPLRIAEKHIHEYGLSDEIECRLSDGMAGLKQGEADCAVIAGMGGDLISRIISDDPDKVMELVLSPHTHPETVRRTLRDINYLIIDESMILDSGKYYTVIRAVKSVSTEIEETKEVYDYFGRILIQRKNTCLLEYLKKEKLKFRDIAQKHDYIALVEEAIQEIEKK